MEPSDRLESWKEIAAYLKRDVRTVQRWEESENLPIHRHQHKKRGSVFAHPDELDMWRHSRRADLFGGTETTTVVLASRSWRVPAAIAFAAATFVVALVLARTPAPDAAATDPKNVFDAPRLLGEVTREGGSLERISIDGEAEELALSPDGATLYVSVCGPKTGVRAIDLRTRTVAWSLEQRIDCSPMVVSRQGDRVFMTDRTDVVIVDTTTRAVQRIGTPGARLNGLALTADGRTLYVAATYRGLLSIDTSTGVVETLSRLPCPMSLALTPAGDRLYVNYQCSGPGGSPGHDAIDVMDTRSNKSVSTITGLPNVGGMLIVSPDGSQVWADGLDACKSTYYDQAGCPDGRGSIVNVIRTSDHTLLRSLRIGPAPEFSVRIGFTNDGSRAVVGRMHTTVVSTASLTEMESSPLPLSGNVAFSPDGRAAYAIFGERTSVAVMPIAEHRAPPPGLTARWMFDGIGTDAAGGTDLGPLHPEAFAPGRVGLSLRSRDTPPIRLRLPPNLDINRGYVTAMAWVKFATVAGTAARSMTVMEYAARGSEGQFGWTLSREADGRATVCLGRFEHDRCDPTRSSLVRGATSLTPGHWHHIAITRAEGTLTLFVNGQFDGSGRASGGVIPDVTDSWMRLGSDEPGLSPLAGLLDEVEIYNRALAPGEVSGRGK